MQRREITGAAEKTALTSPLSNSGTTFTVVSGTTFPTGSSGNPFVVTINRGFPIEEKILCSSRSGNVFTVSQRGFDGTTAENHDSASEVDHVLDALAIQDMNQSTYDNQVLIWMETA
jgi:hypothetical protein